MNLFKTLSEIELSPLHCKVKRELKYTDRLFIDYLLLYLFMDFTSYYVKQRTIVRKHT